MAISTFIAAARMTGNVIAAAVLLAGCVLILRFLRGNTQDRQGGLPLVAFAVGPAFAAFYIWIDYNWIQPYKYRTFADAVESVIPVMIVGTFGGSIGAISIWVGNRLAGRRVR